MLDGKRAKDQTRLELVRGFHLHEVAAKTTHEINGRNGGCGAALHSQNGTADRLLLEGL